MSIFAEQTIDLNLTPGGVLPVIHVSQYDSGYQINFRIFDGSQRYEIPTDVTVRLDMTKTDGQGVSVQATKNNAIASMCYVWLTLQMTTCIGDNECELVFVHRDDERRIGTVNFILQVERAGLRRDAIVSESQISIVQEKLDEWGSVAAYGDALDNAISRISDAEDNINSLSTEVQGKAPTDHASASTKYGVGTSSLYGHLKLWGSTYNPGSSGSFAADAMIVGNLYNNHLLSKVGEPSRGGNVWSFGESFNSVDSVVYCRRLLNVVQVTFSVKATAQVLPGVSRNIITNLPPAMMRTHVQAYMMLWSIDNVPTYATPVMCAIRPEESASNSSQILKVDGATNPTTITPGVTVIGTFMYIASDYDLHA